MVTLPISWIRLPVSVLALGVLACGETDGYLPSAGPGPQGGAAAGGETEGGTGLVSTSGGGDGAPDAAGGDTMSDGARSGDPSSMTTGFEAGADVGPDAGPTPTQGDGGGAGSSDGQPSEFTLDCGADGIALESAGPPENRVNYVIVGDGYTESELETTYLDHLHRMLDQRFTPELEPYLRYRRFINICALKVASAQSGVGTQRGDTAFGGYGNDESRLGYVEDDKVFAAIRERLPPAIEVDWTAVVLNGDRWWNAGGRLMVWSGGHPDAALAAMHEGGHSFQRLADEYGGNCTFSGDESRLRINVTTDPVDTAGKWSHWLDSVQDPGTGLQSIFEGAEYCDRGAYRPSQDSVMNSLWRSSSFNSISLEQAVRIIYEIVEPFDVALSTPQGLTDATMLEAHVVDPTVIKVDWSVDGEVIAQNHGYRLDLSELSLAPGQHTVSAHAHDDTPWVGGDRDALQQTLEWMVEVP